MAQLHLTRLFVQFSFTYTPRLCCICEENKFTHFGFLLRNVHPPLSGGASLKTQVGGIEPGS